MFAVEYDGSVYLVVAARACSHGADLLDYRLHNPYTGFEFYKCQTLTVPHDVNAATNTARNEEN